MRRNSKADRDDNRNGMCRRKAPHTAGNNRRGVEIQDCLLAVFYGGCLSAALLLGNMLKTKGALSAVSGQELLWFILRWMIFAALAMLAWYGMEQRSTGADPETVSVTKERRNILRRSLTGRWRWLGVWFVFFLIQLVSLLAVYPGFFVYDAAEELAMVETRTFSTHHPLLHVLLLGGSILAVHKVTGSYNLGIFCYMLFQMAVMDAVFAALIREMGHGKIVMRGSVSGEAGAANGEGTLAEKQDTAGARCSGKWSGIQIFGILWLAFCPVVTMFVLCSCKDGLFAAALLLMTMYLKRILCGRARETEQAADDESAKKEVQSQSRRDRIGFVVSGTLMMLLRNNGVYAYAVFVVIIGAAGFVRWIRSAMASHEGDGEKGRASAIALFLLPLLLYLGCSQGLAAATHADSSESQEILTVPIMQLARVWNAEPDSFSKEEKALMYELMASEEQTIDSESTDSESAADSDAGTEMLGWEYYNPVLSDQVKLRFRSDVYRLNRGAFWRMWLRQGLQHPAGYLNAWLMTSYGFWAPNAVVNCYRGNTVYTFTYGDSSYFGYETEQPGERRSLLSVLDGLYRFLSLDVRAQEIPVLRWILSPGSMAFVYLFCLLTMLRKRQRRIMLAWMPLGLVWLTVLLGPCTLPRYVVYLWIGIPSIVSDAVGASEQVNV